MFLAIINDTYTDVREHNSGNEGKIEIGSFVRQKLQRICRKLFPCCCGKAPDAKSIEDTQQSYVSIRKLFEEITVTSRNEDTQR